MQITLHPVFPDYLTPARELYEEAFPPEERRPTDDWAAMTKGHACFRAKAILSEGRFYGILTYWTFPECHYIEHFAVTAASRGSGIGSAALDLFLATRNDRPVVLEVEPPETQQAERRIGFYLRHGLALLSHPYLQPPYRRGDDFLPLRLMATRKEEAERGIAERVKTIRREVYGAK